MPFLAIIYFIGWFFLPKMREGRAKYWLNRAFKWSMLSLAIVSIMALAYAGISVLILSSLVFTKYIGLSICFGLMALGLSLVISSVGIKKSISS